MNLLDTIRAWLLPLTVTLSACGSSDATPVDRNAPGPEMRPGENCLSCHRVGGAAARRPWTAAGTVFSAATSDVGVEGAQIDITDATGKLVTLQSNAVGNFHTDTPLQKPLRMRISYQGKSAEMPIALDAEGACNGCHSKTDPIGGALGRIRVP